MSREELRRGIFDAADEKPGLLEVPGWPPVYVRTLSVDDQMALTENHEAKDVPVLILIHALCDENGDLLFTEDDLPALRRQPFPRIILAFGEAAKRNGLSNDELEDAIASFRTAPDGSSSSE